MTQTLAQKVDADSAKNEKFAAIRIMRKVISQRIVIFVLLKTIVMN